MSFFTSVSNSTILEVRKYIYIPTPSISLYSLSSRYATIKFKKDVSYQTIKIPSLKLNTNEVKISNYINTVLESDSLSNVMSFFTSVSNSTILEVRKYIYIPTPSTSLYSLSSRYATIKFKKDVSYQTIKIPSLKLNTNEVEISNYINTIYTNISHLTVTIISPT